MSQVKFRTTINKWMNRLIRFIKAQLFIQGIGKLPKQYAQLTSEVEKAAFCQEHFGKDFLKVLEERAFVVEEKLRKAFK